MVRFANEVAVAGAVLFVVTVLLSLPELEGLMVVSGAEDCAAEGAGE